MSIMTQLAARILLLPVWIIALAILVKGYFDTGDGFSAGVVAALGVLIHYLAFGSAVNQQLWAVRHVRTMAAAGLLIAATVVFVPLLFGDPLMKHWPPTDQKATHLGTLELITAFAFDIGVFLLVLAFCIGVIDLIANAAPRRPR
jgi:multisubunit Na+/H+ antiporter MnhB subunit